MVRNYTYSIGSALNIVTLVLERKDDYYKLFIMDFIPALSSIEFLRLKCDWSRMPLSIYIGPVGLQEDSRHSKIRSVR